MESSYLQDGVKGEHYLSLHILKALAKSLDAHTSYFSPDEAYEMRTSLEKQFEGVGVVLRESVDGVIITEMIKGGPAERCGEITPGDLLVEIDGKSIENAAYEDVLVAMKGEGKKEIELGVKHSDPEGSTTFKRVSLKKEKIVIQEERLQYSAEPFADGIIGKLDLPSFYESSDQSSCVADIRMAIKNLKKKGKLYGIILDLRENSGGFLNQAVKVAGLFITSGVIVISKYSQGEIQYLRDIDGRVYFDGPILVLTSKGSASAAEIVAQALQDYGTALIAGDERTYGKGTIQYQTVTDEGAKAYFKVTIGRYYTVSGKSTQIEGVKADIIVPTLYSHYNIGERYLEYPLKNDRVPSAYADPLSDLDRNSKTWFQKNYLPNVQKKKLTWQKMLPVLTANSSFRLKNDKNFIKFLQALDNPHDPKVYSLQNNWGIEDLQMAEAVNILKDMLLLNLSNRTSQEASAS
jgi:carboxyl-terminal processing protease